MAKILIGALSAWKYEERRRRCLGTWMRDLQPNMMGTVGSVFLMGIPTVPRPQRYGCFLFLPTPDTYPTLPQRTHWFCRWALEQEGWDYLFKCDDDTYVSVPRLRLAADAHCLASHDYVGAEWREGVGYASGGAGYLLSRRAAKIIAERGLLLEGAEDALVGHHLRDAGFPFTIDPRFVPFGNAELRPRKDNDLITLHGVQEDLFLASHRECSVCTG